MPGQDESQDGPSCPCKQNLKETEAATEERDRLLGAARIVVADSRHELCDQTQEERFINHVRRSMTPIANQNLAKDVLTYVLECINDHADMLYLTNRAVLLRLGSSAAARLLYGETDHVLEKRFIEFIVSYIPLMFNNEDLPLISAYLKALNELIDVEPGFNLIMSIRIEPALSVLGGQNNVHDILSFLQCFLQRPPTYHLRNEAESVLQSIIKAPDTYYLEHSNYPRLVTFLRSAIEDCNITIMRQINHVIGQIRRRPKRRLFLAHLDLQGTFFARFDSMLAKSSPDDPDLIMFCECLATTLDCHRDERDKIVERLKARGQIRGIVKFLSCLDDTHNLALWKVYCIYPLLCTAEKRNFNIQEYSQRLLIDNGEREFINKMTDNKFLIFVLEHIETYVTKTLARDTFRKSTSKTITYVAETILFLIRSQLNCNAPKAYGCVMLCFDALNHIIQILKRSKTAHRFCADYLLPALCETSESIMENENIHKEQYYPQAFRNIRELMGAAFSFDVQKSANRVITFSATEAKKAIEKNDTRLLLETLELMADLPHSALQSFLGSDDLGFCALIWQEIWPYCRDSKDIDLIAASMPLLLLLDVESPGLTLKNLSINRYHTIPEIFASRLCDIDTESEIRHSIIKTICTGTGHYEAGYLAHLDSLNLPKTCRPHLNRVLEGLCLSVRSDVSSEMQHSAIFLLSRVIQVIIRNGDNNAEILERLAKHHVLDLIYEILFGDLYSQPVQLVARASLLQLVPLMNTLGQNQIESAMSVCRHKAIISRFKSVSDEEYDDISDDTPIDAIVDEILNASPRINSPLTDCY